MVTCSYDATALSAGSPQRLWSLLVDARSWPRWGTVDSLVLEQSQGISPDGRDEAGAVRAFRTGKVVTSERIVALEEGRRFAYEDAQNPFLKNYQAEVLLTETASGGSAIRWRGTYEVAFGLHLAMRRTMDQTMQRMAQGLARAGDAGPGLGSHGASTPACPLRLTFRRPVFADLVSVRVTRPVRAAARAMR